MKGKTWRRKEAEKKRKKKENAHTHTHTQKIQEKGQCFYSADSVGAGVKLRSVCKDLLNTVLTKVSKW